MQLKRIIDQNGTTHIVFFSPTNFKNFDMGKVSSNFYYRFSKNFFLFPSYAVNSIRWYEYLNANWFFLWRKKSPKRNREKGWGKMKSSKLNAGWPTNQERKFCKRVERGLWNRRRKGKSWGAIFCRLNRKKRCESRAGEGGERWEGKEGRGQKNFSSLFTLLCFPPLPGHLPLEV